jgi:hypothetical protein
MQAKPVVNSPLNLPLTDKRRDLMHRVMYGNPDLAGVMHILHHYKFCDTFLQWMIANNYTGKNLVLLLTRKHGSSVPKLVGEIVTYCNGANTLKS